MPLIRLESNPTTEAIRLCWERILSDPQRTDQLSDTDFQSADDFLLCSGATIVPCIVYMEHDPAALLWLHNLTLLPPTMRPMSAQLGCYVLPYWREVDISQACAAVLQQGLRGYGLQHLWAFVKRESAAQINALGACGFAYEATLPVWQRHEGVWYPYHVYHLGLGE